MSTAHDSSSELMQREEIRQLAEEFAQKLRNSGQPRIDEYLYRAEPSLRERLREELVGEAFSFQYGDPTKDGRLRYSPVSRLGEGGFAQVYAAWDGKLDRIVAIKVLDSTGRIDKQRFLEEARRQANLKHPNLVQVYDAGELPKGHAYAVMEYMAGGTLRQKLESDGPFKPERAARIVQHIALGVAAAHERTDGSGSLSPLVHQDLKPENILFDVQGQVFVADFGLAEPVTDFQGGRARVGGTMHYMSPEQLAFSQSADPPHIDQQSDVWALGVILYELLTGTPPFDDVAPRSTGTCQRVCDGELPSAVRRSLDERTDARIPAELATLVSDCLKTSKKERLGSAKDVAARLENWLSAANNVVHLQLPVSLSSLSWRYGGESTDRDRAARVASELRDVHGLRLSRFVWVPPGQGFSDNLNTLYTVSEGFWIGATPVTNAEYEAFVACANYRGQAEGNRKYRSFGGKFRIPTHPVVGVSWINSMRFCQWLTKKLSACGMRMAATLPSEAEWEYACRAGSRTKYCFGDSQSDLQDYAWIADNSGSATWDALDLWKKRKDWRSYLREVRTRECSTHPVSSKLPNKWGIYDMHGQVWEWCLDQFDCRYRKKMVVISSNLSRRELDQQIAVRGDRANRGGAWNRDALRCTSSFRNGRNCLECFDGLGFRILLRAISE
jgi:serine/threonine protein kinase